MSKHATTIIWSRDGAPFTDQRYSREHRWEFDGGIMVRASASPLVVPAPMSVEAAVDPEEAFVASLASCHMLWFLFHAAKRGLVVDHYRDQAAGVLARNEAGRLAITRVTLRPEASFGGDCQPTGDEVLALHEAAHADCYLANSVRTEVRCEPVAAVASPSSSQAEDAR